MGFDRVKCGDARYGQRNLVGELCSVVSYSKKNDNKTFNLGLARRKSCVSHTYCHSRTLVSTNEFWHLFSCRIRSASHWLNLASCLVLNQEIMSIIASSLQL
jgi:hypothetical protein